MYRWQGEHHLHNERDELNGNARLFMEIWGQHDIAKLSASLAFYEGNQSFVVLKLSVAYA